MPTRARVMSCADANASAAHITRHEDERRGFNTRVCACSISVVCTASSDLVSARLQGPRSVRSDSDGPVSGRKVAYWSMEMDFASEARWHPRRATAHF